MKKIIIILFLFIPFVSLAYNTVTGNLNHAYVSTSEGIDILDLNNPQYPQKVAQYIDGCTYQTMKISGSLLVGQVKKVGSYQANYLRLLDISNPVKPLLLHEITLPEIGSGNLFFKIRDSLLYVPCREFGLHIYDITTPETPQQVFVQNYSLDCVTILLDSHQAYVNYKNNNTFQFGVMVLDITNPISPQMQSQLDLTDMDTSNSISKYNNTLFVTTYGILFSVDVSDPLNPSLLNQMNLNIDPDFGVAEDNLLVLGGMYGIQVLDITNPTSPQEINWLLQGEGVLGLCPVGDYFLTTRHTYDFTILSKSALSNPVGKFDGVNGIILAREFMNNQLYSYMHTDPGAYLVRYDVSQFPPVEIDRCIVPSSYSANLILKNGIGIIMDFSTSLPVIDLSQSPMVHVSSLQVESGYKQVALNATHVFVGTPSKTLEIFSILDIDQPILVSSFAIEDEIKSISIKNEYLIIYMANGALEVYDIFSPANPILKQKLDIGMGDAYWDGEVFWLIRQDANSDLNTIVHVDLSDPTSPCIIAECLLWAPFDSNYLEIDGIHDRLFVIGDKLIYGIDTTNTLKPRLTGSYKLDGSGRNICVGGGYLYYNIPGESPYPSAGTGIMDYSVLESLFVGTYHQAIEVTQPLLCGSWPGLGVWTKEFVDHTWNQIYPDEAAMLKLGNFTGYGCRNVMGLWPSGVWVNDLDTKEWTKIPMGSKPVWIDAGDFDGSGLKDLVGTWDNAGVWVRYSLDGTWKRLSAEDAIMVTTIDSNGNGVAELIGVWTHGVWHRLEDGSWIKLMPSEEVISLTSGDINGDGKGDLIGSWTHGVWWRDSEAGTWVRLNNAANFLTSSDINHGGKDDLIGIWPGIPGIWVRYSEDGTWERLHDVSPGWMTCAKI